MEAAKTTLALSLPLPSTIVPPLSLLCARLLLRRRPQLRAPPLPLFPHRCPAATSPPQRTVVSPSPTASTSSNLIFIVSLPLHASLHCHPPLPCPPSTIGVRGEPVGPRARARETKRVVYCSNGITVF